MVDFRAPVLPPRRVLRLPPDYPLRHGRLS
jgi:hypothetical protein